MAGFSSSIAILLIGCFLFFASYAFVAFPGSRHNNCQSLRGSAVWQDAFRRSSARGVAPCGRRSAAPGGSVQILSLAFGIVVSAVAATGRRIGVRPQISRRAEPVSGAAAAAAAAAAGKAAVARGGAAAAVAAAKSAASGSAAAAAAAAAKTVAARVGAKVAATSVGIGGGAGAGKEEDLPPNMSFDPAVQVGVTEPLGYFDPLGFCKKGDEVGFRKLRAAEIKHGRVAMMASLGAVVQHYVQFPGFDDQYLPKGLGAVVQPPGSYGFGFLFVFAGLLELAVWTERPDKEPGNFGDPLSLGQYDIDTRNREINNGRAAMFAALGIIAAELYTGKDAITQLGL